MLTLGPGCRLVGQGAAEFYDWGARSFAANPFAAVGYYSGLTLCFLAASPLLLISWPLTAMFYPEGEEAFYLDAALAPAFIIGTLGGTVLALPLTPFGLALVPEEEAPSLPPRDEGESDGE